MLKYFTISAIAFFFSFTVLASPQNPYKKNTSYKNISFINCSKSRTPILSCLKNYLFIDKMFDESNFEIKRFTSKANCIDRISKLRENFNRNSFEDINLSTIVTTMAAGEILLDTISDLSAMEEMKTELKQAYQDLQKALIQRDKSYIDSKVFKNLTTEITKKISPLKSELMQYKLALETTANFLEAQDQVLHKDVINNLRNGAIRLAEINKEIQSPDENYIQTFKEKYVPEKLGKLEAELNKIRNTHIQDVETVTANLRRKLDINEVGYKGKIAGLKAEIRQARFSTMRNCGANLALMLIVYWKDNYEDQILPRLLESSPDTRIAKDEYIIMNTVEPVKYCEQIMKDSTIQKIVERRLSLGESLIRDAKK